MKRFNLFRFVFALVCGCHINGVKSQTCSAGEYLNDKGICAVLPYDDHSPVVKAIPGLERCGAFDTTLKVKKYEDFFYPLPITSSKHCKWHCLSYRKCTHFEFDESTKKCSLIGKESFGTKDKNIVSGYGECPKTDKCQTFGVKYIAGIQRLFKTNVKSLKACRKLCRLEDGNTVFSYRFSDKYFSNVRRDCYCYEANTFMIDPDRDWISGDSRCPPCFFYYIKLRNLRNVDNGGPNPYLKKPTVGACQRSCKDNPLCTWFEYDRINEECRHKNFITGEMKKKNVIYGSRDCNCDCNKNGVHGCSNDDVCLCKPGYQGPKCDRCAYDSYKPDRNAKTCYPCNCHMIGSISVRCDPTGQCHCEYNRYTGKKCDRCLNGLNTTNNHCCQVGQYLDVHTDNCIACNCHSIGSLSVNCDRNGQCPCQKNSEIIGKKCDICTNGHNIRNGRCCPPGEYLDVHTDNCKTCNCDAQGSQNPQCDGTGQCPCHPGNNGQVCDTCQKGLISTNGRCCNPYYFFNPSQGRCIDCKCDLYGSKGKNCDPESGQCPCWTHSYTGSQCNQCVTGKRKTNHRCCRNQEFFDLKTKRCTDCACVKGAVHHYRCRSGTGHCSCKYLYKDRTCDDVHVRLIYYKTSNGQRTVGQTFQNSKNKFYMVIKHYCHGKCDVRELKIKTVSIDVNMVGSTKDFAHGANGGFTTSGDKFCTGSTTSTTDEQCRYTGILPVDVFYVLLTSLKNFESAKYTVKIGNLEKTSKLYQLVG